MKANRFLFILSIILIFCLALSACNLPSRQRFAPPTPTSAMLPTPTPTESLPVIIEKTPDSEPRLAEADLALAFGDYTEALKLYSSPPPANTEDYKAIALYGQALTHYK
ncbi:MAG TPA: hypothetical protein PLU23_02535, partial [Anaerolineaceae bacterium]|nr:hypothetical protein [Anaerolineaceae bacterium]